MSKDPCHDSSLIPKRRFGKTELQMPVITCGGMRFIQSWNDTPADRKSVTAECQANLEATIRYGLKLGINHIETARGYGTSEYQMGKLLPTLTRDELIIQTKICPSDSPAEFLKAFETSLESLQLDYVDLLSVHGINNAATLAQALKCMPAIQQLKKEGRCRHVGFSTHAPPNIALKAIETDLFEYVNLHWYYVYHPMNRAPVDAAAARDMGVFIISPCDKGGKLFEPPPKLLELCQPLTPMAFNDLYCLRDPAVHTLSIGAARPSDFIEHVNAVKNLELHRPTVDAIVRKLDGAMQAALGADWMQNWQQGLPRQVDTPGGMNVPEILRLWNFAKGLDMIEFAKMRYNLLGQAEHWFPGINAAEVNEEAIAPLLTKSPFADRIPGILREAHELLFEAPKERQSKA
jgi:predicted aldo/keto reductase-like oxidoreductase